MSFVLRTLPIATSSCLVVLPTEVDLPRAASPTSVHKIDIAKGTQKEPWFIQLNPNGRIPVVVDPNRRYFVVFETAAILLYLEQQYDTVHELSFDPQAQPDEYSRMLQWMFFTVSV